MAPLFSLTALGAAVPPVIAAPDELGGSGLKPSFDVLHIMWRGEIGGAERAVYQLALHQHLDGRRRVALAYGQARGKWCELALESGLPVIDFRMANVGDPIAIWRSIQHLKRAQIHHFHGLELGLMSASSLVSDAKRIYTHRGGFAVYSGRRALRYRAARPLLRRRFLVTGNTVHATMAARRLFQLAGDAEVPATPNGLDLSLLEPLVNRAELRRTQGASDGTVVIGTAANLRAWKRIDWLIEAASRLSEGDWAIWVLGDGPDRDRLVQLADASPVRGRIRFLGRQQRIGDWLHSLDAFVLPSGPLESFGNAAVEAMACRLPVLVAADSPGLIEHVTHEENGLIFADTLHLAAQLERLITEPALRLRLGEAAERHVRETYTMERAVDRYEAVYRKLKGPLRHRAR